MTKFFLIAILFLSKAAFCKDIPVIVYCDDAYNPYAYEKNGQAAGIYTEILSEAFKNLKGYKVSIQPIPWKRAMFALETGEVFAAYPPYKKIAERPFIGAYSEPILDEEIVVYTRKELIAEPKPRWPGDWSGRTIGIFLGTQDIAGKEFNEMLKLGTIKMDEYKGHRKNLDLLMLGQLDGYVNDRLSIESELQKISQEATKKNLVSNLVVGAVVSKEQGYLAFTNNTKKYPYRDEFLKKLNEQIRLMRKNKRIDEIVKKNFPIQP